MHEEDRPAGATIEPGLLERLKSTFAPTPLQDTQDKMRVVLLDRGQHVYAGTVPWAEVQRRRRRNKAARLSRRNNRG